MGVRTFSVRGAIQSDLTCDLWLVVSPRRLVFGFLEVLHLAHNINRDVDCVAFACLTSLKVDGRLGLASICLADALAFVTSFFFNTTLQNYWKAKVRS